MRSFGTYKSGLLTACIAVVALLAATPALATVGPVWSAQSIAFPTAMRTSDAAGATVTVSATGGTFTLTFEGQTTGPIAYGASNASVKSAMEALSSIGGVGGSVIVSDGPTGIEGSSPGPYFVRLAGSLLGVSATTMTANSALLSGGSHTVTIASATDDEYDVQVENIGDTSSSGKFTITDKLPPGVTTAAGTTGEVGPTGEAGEIQSLTCTSQAGLREVTCTSETHIPAAAADSYNNLHVESVVNMLIPVTVAAGVSGSATNTARVSGGGATGSAEVSTPNLVNDSTPLAFGVSFLDALVSNEVGAPFTQAGGHPYAVTVNFGFNNETGPDPAPAPTRSIEGNDSINSVAGDDPREIVTDLPLGLVGNPLAAPRCPLALNGGGKNLSDCPRDTQVGVVYLSFVATGGPGELGPYALFNVVPEPGRPGEFAFDPIAGLVVLYGTVVRTPLGNVVRIVSKTPRANVHAVSVTFFGNPVELFPQKGEDEDQLPFLINPTHCLTPGATQEEAKRYEEERTLTMHVDSWDHPGALNPDLEPDFNDPQEPWEEASTTIPPVEGCDLLPEFNPSHFELAPSGLLEGAGEARAGGTTQADEPSAFEGRLKIPQLETFGTDSRPELKNATVTLPAGLSVSASAAGGLEGCSEERLDPESGEPGNCPFGSQLGTVEVTTPLLEKPLQGHVYLAEPKCGEAGEAACVESEAEEGKLFGLIMELDGEAVIKIPGKVEAGGYGAYSAAHGLQPGQLRAVFEDNPQLPFEELAFHFKEGPRTPLANPQSCGTFTTTTVLEPWSAPFSENAESSSPFNVSWDGKGGGCPSVLPFAPAFTAGTQSNAAGQFSPFVVSFERQDREQDLSGVTVHTPAGMLADLAGVPLCGEAQANAGTCGEASQIGTTSAVVGPGSDPFAITGGRVYLTESYKGGSFGLSIVVPANAGPFHLGNVVVRASIAVNPATAALTVTSNPLPQIVDSVPIRLRKVEVDVNRPGFMFNATNCTSQKVEATLTGLNGYNASSGSSANVSSPYTANGCTSLKFTPKFSVSTSGKTSKADGASLTATLSEPSGSQGTQANVTKVKVELPKAMPSRLTTLQKACTDAQFEANPAACPSESKVGYAVVHTPLLPVPLEGPAIFVSHGGEAFPSLTLVLQGDGVTIDLVGTTDIKNGITSTTFETVPDAPFNTFTLTLPEGKYSALTANGNLCRQKLVMPTEFIGQNGAPLTQKSPLAVAGCANAIVLVSHKLKGHTLTLAIAVPAAGKLKASGKGLKSASKSSTARETITVKLHVKRKQGKFTAKVKLSFKPKSGKALSKTVKVYLRVK